jgi:putative effector of murein hydrolase
MLVVCFDASINGKRLDTPLFNPLLVSIAVIIPLPLLADISFYLRYFQHSKILNDLL